MKKLVSALIVTMMVAGSTIPVYACTPPLKIPSVEIPEKLDFTYLKYYKIKTHFNHDYLDFTGTGKNDIILVNYIAAPEFTLNRHFYVLQDSSDYCKIKIEGSGPLGEVTEIIESNSSDVSM